MERARSGSVSAVSDVIYDMIAAGITPGARSFHGLVVSHVLNRDEEGAVFSFLFGEYLNKCICVCTMFIPVCKSSSCVSEIILYVRA